MSTCWALTDYRPGTANQVLGVARHSGCTVIEKKLNYTRRASLPNILTFGNGFSGLDKASKKQLSAPWPDLVIAAGRRCAPISMMIKACNPNTKCVHLMKPEWKLDAFDMVILPSHDVQSPDTTADNIITTLGAPHTLTDEVLFSARARLPLNPELLPRPWHLLCIGGKSSHGPFMLSDIDALIRDIEPMAHRGTLFVTASRRTTAALAHSALAQITRRYPGVAVESYVSDQGTENPYHAWLAQVDKIIVTADSVSMLSEAAYTGKPIYVFTPQKAAGPKHKAFVQAMIDAEHAKALDDYDPLWQSGVRLNESARLGLLIKKMMGKR